MSTWTPSLELGHETADEDHREQVALMERISVAVGRNDVVALAADLRALFAASLAHFEREEQEMVESAYPEVGLHREAHADFIAEFRRINQEVEKNGVSPLFRLWFSTRFASWMRFHIKGQDASFARHWQRFEEERAKAAQPKAGAAP